MQLCVQASMSHDAWIGWDVKKTLEISIGFYSN